VTNPLTQTMIAAIISAVIASVGFVFTSRSANRATDRNSDVALSTEARAWVTQAQTDAREAKTEAAQAEKQSSEAVRRANHAEDQASQAERKLRDVTSTVDALIRWIERVVRSANDADVSEARLREIINGGPPEMTGSRLRRDLD
jgi:chromosome segregation ATPase